ncbi:MAG: S-ribosylhomocysteine lyase [Cyanobacteria bacterium SIG29]|nr:S-ribosylhomocysteine lyase [Cyanobacteria bacterium SIG29]
MKKIASFTVNHDVLEKGLYISRIDGDIVTYDVRMKKPNGGDYLQNPAMHTFEHLFATFVRNTEYAPNIIYVGPMGCRTGFYLLVREAITHQDTINLLKETFDFVSKFEGEIPGTKKEECGNYLEHDLFGAKEIAEDMLKVLENWTVEKMIYEK